MNMGTLAAYALLVLAACLEAGGDALVRLGLHTHHGFGRIGLFLGGAAVLFVYGLSVNAPNWDFGRLLGVYVTLFFVVAQLLNFMLFGVKPGLPILIGGVLIVSGGAVMTIWGRS
jgi:drug/metabolite transporter superfamily protein YnfA